LVVAITACVVLGEVPFEPTAQQFVALTHVIERLWPLPNAVNPGGTAWVNHVVPEFVVAMMIGAFPVDVPTAQQSEALTQVIP
jgi:hypothetical protein